MLERRPRRTGSEPGGIKVQEIQADSHFSGGAGEIAVLTVVPAVHKEDAG